MSVEWISGSAEETRTLGARLGAALRGGEVVLLCGDLGVGTTQFAQGVAQALGVRGPVVSPTFTLAVHYEGRVPLVHYDLYRVARCHGGADDLGQRIPISVFGFEVVAGPLVTGAACKACHSFPGLGGTGYAVTMSPVHVKHVGTVASTANSKNYGCDMCHFDYTNG